MRHSYFITGIAGFIGFSLARALKRQGERVFGLDNFNAYYTPSLKKERAKLLKEEGIEVLNLDLNSKNDFFQYYSSKNPSHVIHLAAQAGVRHSFEVPDDYVAANFQALLNLLEAMRKQTPKKFLFASSSSVYGQTDTVPFSLEDRVEKQESFYGVTKRAGELMTSTYSRQFGIPSIALRFFTVYGPWGRPDMAYYKFAESIMKNKPIELYNFGDMQRDFTYIDDIVDGIMKALEYCTDFEIFNLGCGSPTSLMEFVETLEKHLGRQAEKIRLPMPPGDVTRTFADLTKTREKLGFAPKIRPDEGLFHFAKWFLERQ